MNLIGSYMAMYTVNPYRGVILFQFLILATVSKYITIQG
jgi:hypothetical protein